MRLRRAALLALLPAAASAASCPYSYGGSFSPSVSCSLAAGNYTVASMTIPAGVTVRTGPGPVAFFVSADVSIAGTIDASGSGVALPPFGGGSYDGFWGSSPGPVGTGGSFGGCDGSSSGYMTAVTAAGGPGTYRTSMICTQTGSDYRSFPFRGGMGGWYGGAPIQQANGGWIGGTSPGGAPGEGIAVIAPNGKLTLTGKIIADGLKGADYSGSCPWAWNTGNSQTQYLYNGAGGGGSGGYVFIVAGVLSGASTGSISANGGAGGVSSTGMPSSCLNAAGGSGGHITMLLGSHTFSSQAVMPGPTGIGGWSLKLSAASGTGGRTGMYGAGVPGGSGVGGAGIQYVALQSPVRATYITIYAPALSGASTNMGVTPLNVHAGMFTPDNSWGLPPFSTETLRILRVAGNQIVLVRSREPAVFPVTHSYVEYPAAMWIEGNVVVPEAPVDLSCIASQPLASPAPTRSASASPSVGGVIYPGSILAPGTDWSRTCSVVLDMTPLKMVDSAASLTLPETVVNCLSTGAQTYPTPGANVYTGYPVTTSTCFMTHRCPPALDTSLSCIVPTATATASLTKSPTSSRSVTASPSRTPTYSGSTTPSPSYTKSITPSPSFSRSITPSASFSRSITPSASFSKTVTVTPTASRSITPSVSFSRSVTPSPSISKSVSPSTTASRSVSPTISESRSVPATVTPSRSVSPSVTPSDAHTASPSPSGTPTTSVSRSASHSAAGTPSVTPSNSHTSSATASTSGAASVAASPSSSSAAAASSSASAAGASPSHSAAATPSPTPTSSGSPTHAAPSPSPSVSPAAALPSPSSSAAAVLPSPSKSAAAASPSSSAAATASSSPSSSPSPSLTPSSSVLPPLNCTAADDWAADEGCFLATVADLLTDAGLDTGDWLAALIAANTLHASAPPPAVLPTPAATAGPAHGASGVAAALLALVGDALATLPDATSPMAQALTATRDALAAAGNDPAALKAALSTAHASLFLRAAPGTGGKDDDDGLSGGAVAGIVIGVLIAAAALVAAGVWARSRGSSKPIRVSMSHRRSMGGLTAIPPPSEAAVTAPADAAPALVTVDNVLHTAGTAGSASGAVLMSGGVPPPSQPATNTRGARRGVLPDAFGDGTGAPSASSAALGGGAERATFSPLMSSASARKGLVRLESFR